MMAMESSKKVIKDFPPFSRLFVGCGNNIEGINLLELFSEFGEVEDIFIPRNHHTNTVKGIAFVKFAKTSQAALAQYKLHNQEIMGCRLKVVVASNHSKVEGDQLENDCRRLFITCSKNDNEDTLYDYFKQFGTIVSITIQREKSTGVSKGFAYITFANFTEAAKAYEEANKVYKVLFAKPKEKSGFSLIEKNMSALANLNTGFQNIASNLSEAAVLTQAMNIDSDGYTKLSATCSNYVLPRQIEALFDLIPGMLHFQYTRDWKHNCPKIFITYSNPISARYAVQKLNYFEYPPGECIQVKPEYNDKYSPKIKKSKISSAVNDLKMAMSAASNTAQPDLKELIDTIAKASSLVKSATTGDPEAVFGDLNYCSVTLPPPQALAHIDSPVVKRCFLVLSPQPPPQTVLLDVFSRFGNLITVYSIPGTSIGYANYASAHSANEAIKTLHGASVCKVPIKVLEAKERDNATLKRKLEDND